MLIPLESIYFNTRYQWNLLCNSRIFLNFLVKNQNYSSDRIYTYIYILKQLELKHFKIIFIFINLILMIIRFQNSALFLIFCFLVSFILLLFLLIPFFPHSSFFSTFILLFFLKSDQIILFSFHKLFLKSFFNFL